MESIRRAPFFWKIDDHIHIVHEDDNSGFRGRLREILQMYEVMGIRKGLIMTLEDPQKQALHTYSCEEAAALSEQMPDRFAWCCNMAPTGTMEDSRKLERYKKLGARGIGEFVFHAPLDDPRIQYVFACAQDLELPILFHMSPEVGKFYGVVDLPGLPMLEKALEKYPKLILVGHSQPIWNEITAYRDPSTEYRYSYPSGPVSGREGRLQYLLDTYPNFYCDLSANSGGNALMRDPDYAPVFMERYQDKLLFGTDDSHKYGIYPLGPWLDQMVCSGQGGQGKLSETVYKKICAENAQRIFKL